MDFNLNERTIFLSLAGSHAYGFATPDSDYDYRGIAIAPLDTYIGVMNKFEQIVDSDKGKHVWQHYPGLVDEEADMQVMELTKFARLASGCNPNVIEVLFSPEDVHIKNHPIMTRLFDIREDFLSKQAKGRFCGYAHAQLKRIQRHQRWLRNPPTHKPTRTEFGLPEGRSLLPPEQIGAAEALIKREIDDFILDQTNLTEDTRIELKEGLGKMMRAVWIAMHQDKPYPVGLKEKFDKTEDALYDGVARTNGLFNENFIEILNAEKRYRAAHKEWTNYQGWLKRRNPDRAALEAKYGYDCYLDDTEFLVMNPLDNQPRWKRYDEISDADQLATVDPKTGEFIYQSPTERVSKQYSGNIVYMKTQQSHCAVTPNHRMLVSPLHRSKKNNFSSEFDDVKADWQIQSMQSLLDSRRSHFHIRSAAAEIENPNDGDYWKLTSIGDDIEWLDYLYLMGAYVSEGCVGKRIKSGKASVLRISQKKGGRICKRMDEIAEKYSFVRRFESSRKDKDIIEIVYTIAHREIAIALDEGCGSGSYNKKLPPVCFKLSTETSRYLLDTMIAGDGTKRKLSDVYYTSSKRLADDVQALCVRAGIISQVWGPYEDKRRPETSMYHVYIQHKNNQIQTTQFRKNSKHISIEYVNNARIVCFTVPNEILITRRNGKVAIQGNTKHGAHLVRLIRMAREILETGTVNVRRDDAEEILAIRNGSWSFEKIVQFSEDEDESLASVMKQSKLPATPNIKKIHQVVCDMVIDFNKDLNPSLKVTDARLEKVFESL